MLTVLLDYVHIYDARATQPSAQCSAAPPRAGAQAVRCWEFNTPGDPEGWFTRESLNISNVQVAGGVLSFQVKASEPGFGFVVALAHWYGR